MLNSKVIVAGLELNQNEKVTIERRSKYKYKDFKMIGKVSNIDFIEELIDLTRPEAWLFKQIYNNFSIDTNRAVLHKVKDSTEKVRRYKAFKALIQRKMILKYRANEYIINPNFIHPPEKYREAIIKEWKFLEDKDNSNEK